jgi:pyruvate dehydrogenase E1 component beta subunit
VTERQISFGNATLEAMQLAMRSDERVLVLGEDIGWGGSFGQFRGLLDEFGARRVVDMPISEAQIVATCVGAALTGLRPVASISFVEFTMGAMDEIVNQAAKLRYMSGGQVSLPLVIRASDGTLRSSSAQHSESFEAIFAHIPGLKVVVPSTPADAKGLLAAAIADEDPVIYLENKKIGSMRGPVPEGEFSVPLGQAALRRSGSDITILAYSIMARHAEQACADLEAEGIDAELVDLRSLVPLDLDTVLESVAKTHRAVVCHEAWTAGGFGAELAAQITEQLFDELEAPIARVGSRTSHIPFSPPLERAVVPQKEEIVEAVRGVLARGRQVVKRR